MYQSFFASIARAIARFIVHPIMLLVIVTISGIVSFALATAAPEYQANAERVDALAPINAASLSSLPVGSPVLLEGHIDAENAAIHGAFVAYVREEYRSHDSLIDTNAAPSWVEVARETPPLRIALVDGTVRLANSDYAFDNTAVTVEEAAPTLTKGAVRARGYAAGDSVLVVGSAVDADGQRAVAAEFLYAGTREQYLTEYRRLAGSSLPIAIPFLLLFVASSLGLAWQIRRFVHEVAAEQAAEESKAAIMATASPKHKHKRPSM